MNKPVMLMVMAPGKGNRRLVLSPPLLWMGLILMLMLFGVGVWGAVAVYQLKTDARQYKDDYAALRTEHQELAANYADLESQLRDIEVLSSDVRHVLGMKKDTSPSFRAPLDGQGGGEELWLDEQDVVSALT
ncbi:MAG: hypothetical protein O3A46_17300, partial [Candidatus Poribacteria bacterium]|nr:hypothetical protein [Candidatus Poribacteria bacterium]